MKVVPPLDYTGVKTLAFDIGGTGLKASIIDENGEMLTSRVRVETPQPCPPQVLLDKFKELTAQLPPYDRISVGFPGVVRRGRTHSAANLDPVGWKGYDLQSALKKLSGPGVVLADMTSMWEALLTRKRFYDLTGNGVNHPNDFGHTIYAQSLLALLVEPPK